MFVRLSRLFKNFFPPLNCLNLWTRLILWRNWSISADYQLWGQVGYRGNERDLRFETSIVLTMADFAQSPPRKDPTLAWWPIWLVMPESTILVLLKPLIERSLNNYPITANQP